jgi:ADP-heptose:LPS heptosyltransferase
LLRRLTEWFRGPQAAPPRRILLVKLAEQGSTVLAVPAIRRAIEMVGRAHVYFLVFQENRAILDAMDLIPDQNVFAVPTGSLLTCLRGAIATLRAIWRTKIDSAIDLEFVARSSAALSFLSGARRRVGFHAYFGEASYRGDLMTHRLSFNGQLHASQVFHMMVEALGAAAESLPALGQMPLEDAGRPLEFRPSSQEVQEVRQLLAREGQSATGPMVLLNPNCSDLLPLRSWPSQRYVELAQRLTRANPQLQVVFTGGPSEAAATSALAATAACERVISLAGKTTLRQLLVLYSLADVLVTNDSGPAHFGSLTPIDVVVLFGPETPRLFAARTPRTHVLWSGIACSPCVNAFNNRQSACHNNICMQRIEVDQVLREVEGICAGRRPPHSA